MGRIIGESCYKGTILQRNYRNMTRSFYYNFFVKFHDNILVVEYDIIISKSVL